MDGMLIGLEVFTDSHRIFGQVAMTRASYLTSRLANAGALVLKNASVSRISEPGHVIATHTSCALCRERINFIILQGVHNIVPRGELEQPQAIESVFLMLPGFELQGTLYSRVRQPTAESLLSPQNTSSFLDPIIDGMAFCLTGKPESEEVKYTGKIFLVSRRCVEYVSIPADVRPAFQTNLPLSSLNGTNGYVGYQGREERLSRL